MAFHDTIDEYTAAADQRLTDARELMEPPTRDAARSDAKQRHLRGAMYLAGYAVECLLKAYLIQQEDTPTLSRAMRSLDKFRISKGQKAVKDIAHTAAGHQIVYLVKLTNLETYPGYDEKLWGRVGKWQSSWRYESGWVEQKKAQEFLKDVEVVVRWLQPKFGG